MTIKDGYFFASFAFFAFRNVLKYLFVVFFEHQPNFAKKGAPKKTITFHNKKGKEKNKKKKNKKKQRKKKKNKRKQKRKNKRKKNPKIPKNELFSHRPNFSFLVGVQSFPFLTTWPKNAHPKNTAKIGVSAKHFLKNRCASRNGHFGTQKPKTRKFRLSFFCFFLSVNNKT